MHSALVVSAFAAASLSVRHAAAQDTSPGNLLAGLGAGGIASGAGVPSDPIPSPAGPAGPPGPPAAPGAPGPITRRSAFRQDADSPAAADDDAVVDPQEVLAGPELKPPPDFPPRFTVIKGCGCTSRSCGAEPDTEGVRAVSDLMDGGTAKSSKYTNMVWSWGQFLDHDFVASFGDKDAGEYSIELPTKEVEASRVLAGCNGRCRQPKSAASPTIDGGPIYSNVKSWQDGTLREPGSCKLRVSAGNLPPVTTKKFPVRGEGGGEPDPNAPLKHFFLAGDARVNEHSILTNMHTIWIREHNRLCDEVGQGMDPDRAFRLVKRIVIAEMQEITLFEWLPALGISPQEVFFWRQPFFSPLRRNLGRKPSISTEFFITYRWGHTGVPNSVAGFNLADIFDGEKFMEIETAAGTGNPDINDKVDKLLRGTATEPMAALDGQMSDALRNMLFGEQALDLASFNIFRARDIALPGYRQLAYCYGLYPSRQVKTNDPFVGTVQERPRPGSGRAFGPLLTRIMVDQFHRVFFGRGGNWWEFRRGARRIADRVIGVTLADVINRNSGANVPQDAFLVGGAPEPKLFKPGPTASVSADLAAADGDAAEGPGPAGPADPTAEVFGDDQAAFSGVATASARTPGGRGTTAGISRRAGVSGGSGDGQGAVAVDDETPSPPADPGFRPRRGL